MRSGSFFGWRPGRAAGLLAGCAICMGALSGVLASTALASRSLSVKESVHTSLINRRGTTLLNERGSGSGTFSCSVTLKVNITYTSAVMRFGCTSSSGSFNGLGRTSFVVAGPIANFDGTMSVTHGTGRYAHVSAPSLHMKGTVQRHTYKISASISGTMKL